MMNEACEFDGQVPSEVTHIRIAGQTDHPEFSASTRFSRRTSKDSVEAPPGFPGETLAIGTGAHAIRVHGAESVASESDEYADNRNDSRNGPNHPWSAQ